MMEKRLTYLALFLLSVVPCYGTTVLSLVSGLELTLNRESQNIEGTRNVCGIVTCSQHTNNLPSTTSDDDHISSKVLLKNITSLSVFKIHGDVKDGQNVLIGSVTSQAPSLSRVSNGRKVDGFIDPGQAKLTVALSKNKDCLSDFTCQVRGLDGNGREAVSTTHLVHRTRQKDSQMRQENVVPAMSVTLLSSIQQLITQSVKNLEQSLEDKVLSLTQSVNNLENRVEDKVLSIYQSINNLENRFDDSKQSSEHRLEDKILQQQKDFNDKIDSFEHRLDNKLDTFKDKIMDKIENNNNNKQCLADMKVSLIKDLAQFRGESDSELTDSFYNITEGFKVEQSKVLNSFSESFERTLSKTSRLLTTLNKDFSELKKSTEENLGLLRNETGSIQKLLISGEISSRCLQNDTNDTLATACYRGMGNNTNKSYFPYEKVVDDKLLKRDLLCDTKTDGGGWIVIQRRKTGNVDFYKTWNDYKRGFGDLSTDFWLGNDAIHTLTSTHDYELRIDTVVNGKDLFAQYASFGITDESDKYRLRVGSHSGTLGEKTSSNGLSHHKGQAFSTYDQDNEQDSRNCAQQYHGAWWYKGCFHSNLNGMWNVRQEKGMKWYTGRGSVYATSTEMKIRRV